MARLHDKKGAAALQKTGGVSFVYKLLTEEVNKITVGTSKKHIFLAHIQKLIHCLE
jgi:hypothetical protein